MLLFGKSGCIRPKWLYSAKVVVFGEECLYSGKLAVLDKRGCIGPKWLYSKKVVVFGQNELYSGKSYCIRTKGSCILLKAVVFGQSGGVWAKVVVLGKKWICSCKWLYSGKTGCIRQKWL